mgnify:CR=1 FL=1
MDIFLNIERTLPVIPGRPPVDQYLDLRVFLDLDFSRMAERALLRDGGAKAEVERTYREKRIPVQKAFFREFRPRERSNFVINNNDFAKPAIVSIRDPRQNRGLS